MISRYEESNYQTIGIARLQEILDAIGIDSGQPERLIQAEDNGPRICTRQGNARTVQDRFSPISDDPSRTMASALPSGCTYRCN